MYTPIIDDVNILGGSFHTIKNRNFVSR